MADPTKTVSVLDRPLAKSLPRVRKVGSASDLRRTLWKAIKAVESLRGVPDVTPNLILRTSHALAQAAGVYLRTLEVENLEERIQALENASHGRTPAADSD